MTPRSAASLAKLLSQQQVLRIKPIRAYKRLTSCISARGPGENALLSFRQLLCRYGHLVPPRLDRRNPAPQYPLLPN